MKEMITGAEALLRSLVEAGVDTVFGYPGGAILPVYDSLYDFGNRLRHILVRHEQGAIHAAQGYARATNRPGVVIVTSGPGAANVITGLSDALMDSTPVVAICGQVASQFLGSDAFQETDVVGITQPITKWALQVRRPEDIPDAVAKAFHIASSGRPGPVVLDIARDAQVGQLEWHYTPLKFIRSYNPRPIVAPADIVKAADIINSAERPLILAGHGIMIAEAENELRRLAEAGNIPVATTLLGLSTLPASHPLNKGMLGMHGNAGPNFLTNRADVIIAIGMRFDDRVTGDTSRYAPDARIIHIDIDESEFNRHVQVHTAIHGDARDVMRQLIPLIEPSARRDRWSARFDEINSVEQEKVKNPELDHSGTLTMGQVANAVARATGGKAILVTDVGQNQMMSARYFPLEQPRSIITSGGLGTMGFGLPAAIGAKIGNPERTVCLFTGDGGLQMTIQELGTIMQHRVGVKIILLNNNFLGNVRQWQKLFFDERYSHTRLLNPDFKGIAASYGIAAEDVAEPDELPAAIERMLASDEPYLLNVNIDEEGMVFPMTPPGASVDTILLNETTYFSPLED